MLILKITRKTNLYAVIGDPIVHSISPVIQNAAFGILGINSVYFALRVESSMLSHTIDVFKEVNILGFNVTIPHKVAIMKYLDELDCTASTIGAVNTVVNHDGKLIGYNTDGSGALLALRKAGFNPSGKRLLLLGAGGAARAIAFSLSETAEKITILNRTVSKAKSLANDVRRATGASVTYGEFIPSTLIEEVPYADLLVNATSIGMNPKLDETPVDAKLLRPNMVVFDIVYNPPETRFLKEAKEVGAKSINGLMMLVYQGAQAFQIWTGMRAPILVMTKALKTVFRSQIG